HWITTGTLPNAGFAWSDTVTCFGGTVTMYNTTPQPVTSWSWNFGDGQIYTGYYEQISHIFDVDTAVLNPLTITMVAFNNGCPDTIILQNLITVLPPKPLFAYTHSCSTPLMLNFINESIGATNYQWDFGDTTTYSTDMSPAHVYLNSGFYSVNLTAFDSVSGCSFTKNYNCPVTIPVSNFTASPLYGCYPLTVNFTDNSQDSDPNYYHWNFGDPASFPNDTSVLLNPNHLFNSPGTYDVVLKIVDIFNCPDSSVQIIHVFGTTAGFTSNLTSGCSPFNVVFDDTSHLDYSAVLSHQWNFGNGSSTVNSSMVSNSYSSPGSYSVTLTVVDTNGCHSSITQPNYITVYLPEPTLSISDTFACPGQSVTFAISSGNNVSLPVNYQINYGDFSADSVSVSSTNQSFSHTYSSNNSLLVTVLVTDTNGCDSLVSGHLTILKPAANYSVTTFDTCINQPPFNTNITTTFAYFTNLSTGMPGTTGNSWHWNFGTGSGTQSVLQNPSCHYNIPGYYTPQLIVTNAGGCSDTARLDSIVNVPGPNGSFSFIPAEGCAPLLINFSGSSSATGLFYTWDFGDGNVSSQVPDSVVTHLYLQDGMYYPFYYIGYTLPSGSTCNSVGLNTSGYIRVKTFMTVNINPAVVEIPDGYDTTVVAIVFDTTLTGGPPFIYNWSPSANIHSTDSLALVFLSNNIESAYYYCTVTNAAGCKATDSLLVLLFPCDVRSIIPNVFTPNDDGINDTYHITYLCAAIDFKFSIFNRWGKMIYESSDPDFHWNGKTVKGDDATEGTYYYVMHAHRRDAHGMIELIRREKK
ncbi:MAG: PKD domain-containing protein, partial [Bacteroidetes bacterium]|nr:PKD domain-containing protein [Bacteroidota bacterium]